MRQPMSAGATLEGLQTASTRLRGWRLVLARAFVFTFMAGAIALFVVTLPGVVPRFAVPCADALNACLIAPQQVKLLAELSVSPVLLARTLVAASCVLALVLDGGAVVLVLRRSDDWIALLVDLTFVLLPLQVTPVLDGLTGVWQVPANIAQAASGVAIVLLILLFPSGRFAPRWVWLPLLITLPLLFVVGPNEPPVFGLLMALCSFGILIASQVYRYRRASTPVQRQQTKWVVYGFVLALAVNQVFWQTYGNIPALDTSRSLYSLLWFPDSFLSLTILVVCFVVAIQRHQLFDIDVLIRRTLVYGALTVILGALYFGVVLGGQALLRTLTGQQGQQQLVFIVASTLLVAALVTPLRCGLQAFIDRRFFRRKYDAAKTLATFGATLRSETDLGALNTHLLAAVRETMQPESVFLWLAPLRPTARQRPDAAFTPEPPLWPE